MALHLLKLCVGCDSIGDLEDWIEENRAHHSRLGRLYEQTHTTRMVPKRMDALVDGGSLYWVIRGQIACRQRLLAIRPFTDAQGIGRCHLVLEPTVTPVEPRPFRPFQGWRYLGRATRRATSAALRATSRPCPKTCGAPWRNWDCCEGRRSPAGSGGPYASALLAESVEADDLS